MYNVTVTNEGLFLACILCSDAVPQKRAKVKGKKDGFVYWACPRNHVNEWPDSFWPGAAKVPTQQDETRRLLVEAYKNLRAFRSPTELMDEIERFLEKTGGVG